VVPTNRFSNHLTHHPLASKYTIDFKYLYMQNSLLPLYMQEKVSIYVLRACVEASVLPDDIPPSRTNTTLRTVQIYKKTTQNPPTLQFMLVPPINIDPAFRY